MLKQQGKKFMLGKNSCNKKKSKLNPVKKYT